MSDLSGMHESEVPTSVGLVRRLLQAQFPELAGLEIAEPLKVGTSNAIFRVGSAYSIRLPRIEWAVPQAQKEARWLPLLARHVAMDLPVPHAVGAPGEGYPFPWLIAPWINGASLEQQPLDAAALMRAVEAVCVFVTELRRAPTHDAAGAAPLGTDRGAPLLTRDAQVRLCIDQLGDLIDRSRVTASWEASLAAGVYLGPPQWVHGDLSPGNMIHRGGGVVGVIDFGCLATGDPACDLLVAWNTFRGEARAALRRSLHVDSATWLRGRGWALSWALIALPYYLKTNPTIVELAWRVLGDVLDETGRT